MKNIKEIIYRIEYIFLFNIMFYSTVFYYILFLNKADCKIHIDKEKEDIFGYFQFNNGLSIHICKKSLENNIKLFFEKEYNFSYLFIPTIVIFVLAHEEGHYLDYKNSENFKKRYWSSVGVQFWIYIKENKINIEEILKENNLLDLLFQSKEDYVRLESYAEQHAILKFKSKRYKKSAKFCFQHLYHEEAIFSSYFILKELPKIIHNCYPDAELTKKEETLGKLQLKLHEKNLPA